jgi:hypothetical protein
LVSAGTVTGLDDPVAVCAVPPFEEVHVARYAVIAAPFAFPGVNATAAVAEAA